MSITRLLALMLLLIIFSVIAFGQNKPVDNAATQQAQPKYASILAQVEQSDPDADFTALRFAFLAEKIETGDGTDHTKDIRQAFNNQQYDKVIEYGQQIIKAKFVDINAHIFLASAYREKGEVEKAKFHHYVAKGLIDSIFHSGDGKTEQTAYIVISISEEYMVLRIKGLAPSGQSLIHKNGHSFDRLDATDPETNQKLTLFFNIDKFFGRE